MEPYCILTLDSDSLDRQFRVGALVIGCALFVGLYYLGAQPFAVGLLVPPYDKLAHFTLFFVLASLFWLAAGGRWSILIFLVVAGLGALDEWHQAYLPGRAVDVVDFLTDTTAAACAITWLHWRRRQRNAGIVQGEHDGQ